MCSWVFRPSRFESHRGQSFLCWIFPFFSIWLIFLESWPNFSIGRDVFCIDQIFASSLQSELFWIYWLSSPWFLFSVNWCKNLSFNIVEIGLIFRPLKIYFATIAQFFAYTTSDCSAEVDEAFTNEKLPKFLWFLWNQKIIVNLVFTSLLIFTVFFATLALNE